MKIRVKTLGFGFLFEKAASPSVIKQVRTNNNRFIEFSLDYLLNFRRSILASKDISD